MVYPFLKLSALFAGEEPQGGGGAEHLASPQHRGGELPQSKPDGFASSLGEGASGAPANFAL